MSGHGLHCDAWRLVTAAVSLVLLCATARAGEIVQQFPAVGNLRTQWRIVWGIENHAGGSEILVVREAYFKRGPTEAEIKVLGDCRLADIFVPYNNGYRIYDISGHNFSLVTLDRRALGPSCVAAGKIYSRDGQVSDTGLVATEVHDGHIRWMNSSETIRRGQSLTMWSVLNGANYRYIILYEFRDDGLIGFRLGATAHNLISSDGDETTHLHMACWRINVELGGASETKVSTVRLDTTAQQLVVSDLQTEARVPWMSEQFTRLRVTSTTRMNSHNPAHPISYELVPDRMGSGRYHGVGEQFTQNELWVTRYRAAELRPRDLDQLENAEAISGQPTTLWHHAPVLHVPRDEDFGPTGTNAGEGVAITTWAGCDLKPRNFFGNTPLYP
jgi:hypothetical protein